MEKLCLLLALCLLFCGCQKELIEETPTPPEVKHTEEEVEQPKEETPVVPTETVEEQPTIDWPYPAIDMNKPVSDDEDVLKYFDYFNGPAQHVIFLENEENGDLTDKSIAVYSYLDVVHRSMSVDGGEGQWTVPIADMDDTCMKFFGKIPTTYKSSMLDVDPVSNTVTATGWGGWSNYYLLNQKEELPEGKLRLVFEVYGGDYISDEMPMTWEEYRYAILTCQWDCLPGKPFLKEFVVTEKIDENGEFYVQYHSIQTLDAET